MTGERADPGTPSVRRAWLDRARTSPAFWSALLLAATLIAITLANPDFARIEWRNHRLYGAPVDILQNGTPVMLLALGMTLVIATGGIDLSVGSVLAMSGAVAALLVTRCATPGPLAIAAALGVGTLIGVWNGVLVAYLRLQPIVATLVALVAVRGLALWLTDDQKVPFHEPTLEWLGNGHLLGVPVPIVLAALLALAVLLALRLTVLGLYLPAVGVNPRAARLCGLRVDWLLLFTYGFAGFCAALAGLIVAADIREADVANAGLYLELDAILAVVIGGTSLVGGRPRPIGTLCGALIMQSLTVALQMRAVVTEYALLVKALAVVLACTLQSERFFEWFRARREVRSA